jgi:DNA modification methylase
MEVGDQTVFFKSSENMDEIPSETITLVVTSPPYWNVRDYGSEQIGFGQSYEEYINSLNKVWKECIRVLQPNGKIAINVQPLPIDSNHSGFGRRIILNIMFDIEKFFRENGFFMSGMHYWDKAPYISNVSWGSYPKPTNIASNTSFEQIFVFVKSGKTRKVPTKLMNESVLSKEEWRHFAVRCIWDDISPVIKIDSSGENRFGHSAPFPEEIPFRLIKMHTTKKEAVLDPFLGSGTTLKVCRITGRKGIGYEINQEYRELIKTRILEGWKIPPIEAQYKTFGTNSFYKILKEAQLSVQNNPTISFKELIKELHRKAPNKFTKSWINHLIKLEVE